MGIFSPSSSAKKSGEDVETGGGGCGGEGDGIFFNRRDNETEYYQHQEEEGNAGDIAQPASAGAAEGAEETWRFTDVGEGNKRRCRLVSIL